MGGITHSMGRTLVIVWKGKEVQKGGISASSIHLQISTIKQSTYNHQSVIMMTYQQLQAETRKKYSKISLKKRQSLIELVVEKGESLTKTSKRLNIKLSTAKLILRKYRKTGELFNKNMGGKPKKTRTSRKDIVLEEESETCKRQQGQMSFSEVKIEESSAEIAQKDPILPSVFYPAYDINWLAYQWLNYANQL